MAYKVLLGRDFLSCPSLRITFGDVVKSENADEALLNNPQRKVFGIYLEISSIF